jgi:uncharacterized protein (DUF488 family)
MIDTDFFTIGVYGLTADEFFNKLTSNNIDTFIDIRRRRAVRGSKFSFVNSKRLQAKLAELKINYLHILELAPTNEIRNMQKEEDKKAGVAKRERHELGETFISEYKNQILFNYDLKKMLSELQKMGSTKAVLFCVEKEASACHRSLVSEKLNKDFGLKPINL